MTMRQTPSEYGIGSTDSEYERLIRQGALLAPLTERLFREACIGSGHRVLDLGSGVGDVAILATQLVGERGEVVGMERDAGSIRRRPISCGERKLAQCDFPGMRRF